MLDYPDNYKGISAVAYARVSSKEQHEEGHSIPAQLRLLEEYAQHPDRSINLAADPFVDVETAKAAGRANFNEMVQFLREHPGVRHILVEKTDRLYRNLRDYSLLEDLDVIIHLVKENEILSRDSRSHTKFIHGIKVLMAKNYIDNLSEEVKKGMDQKAANGDWPSPAPIGYIRNTENHLIEIDPERAPLVRRLFQEYATGKYSLKQLARFARKIGLRSQRGHNLTKATVHRILSNLIYTGDFIYKGKRYSGNHDAIIDYSLYSAVQSILTGGSGARRTKHNMAFQGLVKCGICGCSMTPDIKKGRYVYYRCTGFRMPCKNMVSESVLADLFAEKVSKIRLSADLADALRLALLESQHDKTEFHKNALKSLEREYHTVKRRLDRAYEDRLDGVISEQYWQEKARLWNGKLVDVEASMKSHREANQNYLESGTKLIAFAEQIEEQYSGRSNHERRQLIDAVVSHSTYADGTLCVTYRKPFDSFVKGSKTRIWRG